MDCYRITMDGDVPDADRIAPLLERGRPPLPPFADRAAWAAVAQRPWIAERLPALRERAERLASDGPKRVRATDYLDFFRRGVRDAHEASSPNASDLAILTAVECLDGEGRFMDALLDLSWAVAEETSWIMPPHLRGLTSEPLPDVDTPQIDLRVAMVAKALAEMCCVLGPQMDAVTPHWRRRVQHELQCQAIGPYLDRHFWWDTCDSNWNAVCTDGVVAAALLGDFDAATRARVLAKAARSVPRFLSGFTADGGCTEGPGYWAFGMGHFSSLCYYVDCATGGGLDLLADPVLRGVYAYPTTVVLSGSKVVNFADCPPRVGSRSGAVAWAAGRLGVDRMTALVSHGTTTRFLMTTLLDILLAPEPAAFEPPAQAFLPDLMLLVARGEGDGDERLTLAVKGGHNAEIHNHNDVGAFIIHRRGESLVCDLGSGKYVKEFFGPHRYEFLTTRSAGHNVPLVNGFEQMPGAEHRAEGFGLVEEAGKAGVRMELRSAYPAEADLQSLERRVVLHKGAPGRVELTDTVRFAGRPRTYEVPLYTEGVFEPGGAGRVVARGESGALEITWDAGLLDAAIDTIEHGDDRLAAHFGPTISRCTFRLKQPARSVDVRLTFTPSDDGSGAGE